MEGCLMKLYSESLENLSQCNGDNKLVDFELLICGIGKKIPLFVLDHVF